MPQNHDAANKAVQNLPALPPGQPPGPRAERQVEIFDRADPRSLINIVPSEIQRAIEALAEGEHSELLELDESSFKKRLKEERRFISPTDNRIRIRFWDEYDRAQGESRDLRISHAFAGVCTRQYFYQSYLKDPFRLAWLLCPPASYLTIAEEALSFGLEQLREILAMENEQKDPKTGVMKLDLNLLKLKVKVVEMLDARLKGGILQKSVQVNVGATANDVNAAALGLSMEEMQRQMKDLERRERLAVRGAQPAIEAEIIPT